MRSLFEPAARDDVIARLERFTPECERQWGKLTPHMTLTHLADQLRMAFGEVRCGPPRGALSHWPLNYLLIHVVPWPKGKAKGPPDAFRTAPSDWATDRAAVVALVQRFAAADPAGSWPANPIFGKLSGHDWGALCYKHLDHHLRQFSC
ncbi:MAG: DinB family protein [Gemmatimonadaceae bacterium]|nr:DinB family protein [Gemmatimonadaceae bacterium]